MDEKFWSHNSTLEDLKKEIDRQKLKMNCSESIANLFEPKELRLGYNPSKKIRIPNRLAIHPMEGCDADGNGNPSELTLRRAERFGKSGAGIIWFEATSVVPEGRANPRQLMINKMNLKDLAKIVERADYGREKLLKENPNLPKEIFAQPLRILQLTHSGRYSRPNSKAKEPLRAYEYGILDEAFGIDPLTGSIASDEYLNGLKGKYIEAISHAQEAGFDGVGIKSCHRYLISELLSGYSRKNSIYGGESFENRSRFLIDIIETAVKEFPEMIITLRLNLYDGISYPYGFGVRKDSKDNPPQFDPKEPIKLLNRLHDLGVNLVNTSVGNPYYIPYISRPYDMPAVGTKNSPEHPLKSIERILQIERAIKSKIPKDMVTIGTGFSWLRHLASYIAAGEIKKESFDIIGFGRMAFANPQFPVQIYQDDRIDHKKSCICCSKCTDLMRFDSKSGCVIRDVKTYGKIYREARMSQKKK